jgi:hypothetical protein
MDDALVTVIRRLLQIDPYKLQKTLNQEFTFGELFRVRFQEPYLESMRKTPAQNGNQTVSEYLSVVREFEREEANKCLVINADTIAQRIYDSLELEIS